jgi:EAL domain-containing protein (putative c-di-GMP-specific phosphodiesterase class I)
VLDDFGTGFGAFAYLRNLPISGVKIGMEFVQALPSSGVDQRIVEAIVSVAGHLGLTTVAEGVEEQRTLELLDGMGVTCAQGYAIGRPAPCPP